MENRLNGNGESGPLYTNERINRLFGDGYGLNKEESPILFWVYVHRINQVDDWTTRAALRALMSLAVMLEWRIKDQETETHNLDWGLERLYGHVMDLRREVFPLRQEVKRLRSRVSRLEENEAEKAVTEAVEAMEDGEDMETVFEILGRPEPLNEEVES